MEVSVAVPFARQYPEMMGSCLTGYTICFESKTIMWYYLPIARIHESRNQQVEMGIASFTINIRPNNSCTGFLLPIQVSFSFAGL